MAKRTRSQANGGAPGAPEKPKTRRSRANAAPEPDTIGAYPGVERSEDDGVRPGAPGGDGRTGESATQSIDTMGREPTEQEIRRRAYERYLERGGNDGMDFEDWLQAERELKQSRHG